MRYLKYFESKNILVDNIVDGKPEKYYNVPFSLGENEVCIKGIDGYGGDDYVLCFSGYYVYDYIQDCDIKNALNCDLSGLDISNDWTKSISSFETAYTNKEKHTLIIAKLVSEIRKGEKIRPINMCFDERSYQMDIKNYIEDGNHRIRALQYLGYDYYPAFIYGNFAEYLINYLDKL